MSWEIRQGDWIERLREMPAESVHCCVTSPPYWGLRDYGVSGQLGLEPTPAEYVSKMVEGFREVRRVLRSDGTLWLNCGDSYSSGGRDSHGTRVVYKQQSNRGTMEATGHRLPMPENCKPKDLVGIPWMLAFALRADGWWLRQDIIWAKYNPMPESVRDRCTKAHEYLFLLAKSARYYFNAEAIQEKAVAGYNGSSFTDERDLAVHPNTGLNRRSPHMNGTPRNDGDRWRTAEGGVAPRGSRNKRSVWEIATLPFPEAHFATFPPKLVEPCILAGCPEGGTVLDPFTGAGTTGLVALRYHRNFIGIELKQEYCEMARRRITTDAPLFRSAELVGGR